MIDLKTCQDHGKKKKKVMKMIGEKNVSNEVYLCKTVRGTENYIVEEYTVSYRVDGEKIEVLRKYAEDSMDRLTIRKK